MIPFHMILVNLNKSIDNCDPSIYGSVELVMATDAKDAREQFIVANADSVKCCDGFEVYCLPFEVAG